MNTTDIQYTQPYKQKDRIMARSVYSKTEQDYMNNRKPDNMSSKDWDLETTQFLMNRDWACRTPGGWGMTSKTVGHPNGTNPNSIK